MDAVKPNFHSNSHYGGSAAFGVHTLGCLPPPNTLKLGYQTHRGSKMFDVRCSMFGVRCSMFDVRCSMFDVRCSMFDVRCSMFDVRCSMICPPPGDSPGLPRAAPQSDLVSSPYF